MLRHRRSCGTNSRLRPTPSQMKCLEQMLQTPRPHPQEQRAPWSRQCCCSKCNACSGGYTPDGGHRMEPALPPIPLNSQGWPFNSWGCLHNVHDFRHLIFPALPGAAQRNLWETHPGPHQFMKKEPQATPRLLWRPRIAPRT